MKKIALIIITALTLNLVLFAMPIAVHAKEAPGIESSKKTFSVTKNLKLKKDQTASYFNNVKKDKSSPIVNFISKIIEYFTYIIGSIAMILVIISGFMMMISQGNQQKIDESKDMFTYAIIGLLIVFLSYIITIFVQSIFISAT